MDNDSEADTPNVTVYIEVTLKISLEEYLEQQNALEMAILEVLQAFLPTEFTTVKRASSTAYEIKLSLDMEKSSADISVLKVYIVNSETGKHDLQATVQFYNKLFLELDEFVNQLETATSIVSWITILLYYFCYSTYAHSK